MKAYPKLASNHLNYTQKYMKDATTTRGAVPWVLGGDESGALVPGEEQRFSVYAMAGVPFFTYKTFCSSLPVPKKHKFTEDQLLPVLSLFKKCYGRAAIVYFDLNDKRMIKVVEKHEKLRRESLLSKPEKTAHVVWLDAMAFSIIELVGAITIKHAPVGNLHIHYDDRDMTDRMKELMGGYVPKQAEVRLREIFEGLISDLGFNPFPKANPLIEEFGPGKTKEPLVLTADLLARTVFQKLRDGSLLGTIHETVMIKNLTDILSS